MRAKSRAVVRRDERGAGLVEFALVLPLLMAVILGIFTGGLAYHRKQSITHASREASRFGATLPVSNYSGFANPMEAWLDAVANLAVDSASGELGTGVDSRYLCVAYVYPNGTDPLDRTTQRLQQGATTATYATTTCFNDGRPATERRVQVEIRRGSDLEFVLFNHGVTLTGRAVTRFEAAPTP